MKINHGLHVVFVALLTGLITLGLAGCPDPPRDILAVSQTQLDFGVNPNALNFQVWVTEPNDPPKGITATPQEDWILVEPREVSSSGPDNRQTIEVGINRSALQQGTHEGSIRISASGAMPKTITVRVEQEEDGDIQGALNVSNASARYSAPYLLEFDFLLTDDEGEVVIAEPSAFEWTAREDLTEVNPQETGVHLERGATRLMKMELVLDYSLSMQLVPNAISAMQNVCIDVLLPALNEDSQVGITEFHREDLDPARVSDFTVDRDYLVERIEAIQTEYVNGFPAGARTWDALIAAVEAFDEENENHEARYVVLFSDGNNTSSLHTMDDAVEAAQERDVIVFAVGLGANINRNTLRNLAHRTGGVYFDSDSVAELEEAVHWMNDVLSARYNLRWASLRRSTAPVQPSFSLTLNGETATYTASESFYPVEHEGDVLEGRLYLDRSDSANQTTVFLRADYVPRYVDQLHLAVESPHDFTVSLVDVVNEGLLADWSLEVEALDAYNLQLEGDDLPFATFGPMLRFDFDTVLEPGEAPFTTFEVDNSVYANGQYFVVTADK